MAKKTVQNWSKPRQANADEWVSGQTPATKEVLPPPAKPAKTKRLTLDLSEDLHRRVKLACTIRGSTMVEEITKLLEKEFRP
jgi:ParG